MSNNKKLLRNLLTTASMLAVVAGGASNAAADVRVIMQNDGSGTQSPAASGNFRSSAPADVVVPTNSALIDSNEHPNMSIDGSNGAANTDLNNATILLTDGGANAAPLAITVNSKGAVSFNAIVQMDGAKAGTVATLILNSDASLSNNNIGRSIFDNAQTGAKIANGINGGDFSGLSKVTIADGKTLTVKDGVGFDATVDAANAGNGTVTFEGSSVVNGAFGATKSLNLINVNGAAANGANAAKVVEFKANVTATTLNIGKGGTVKFTGVGAVTTFTGNITTSTNGAGIVALSNGGNAANITGNVGAADKMLASVSADHVSTITGSLYTKEVSLTTANSALTVTGVSTINSVVTANDGEGTLTLDGATELGAAAVAANGANAATPALTIGEQGKSIALLALQGANDFKVHADVFAKTISASNPNTNLILDNGVTLNGALVANAANNGIVTIGNANAASTNTITGNIGANGGNAWNKITFAGASTLNLGGNDFNISSIEMPALLKNASTGKMDVAVLVNLNFTEHAKAVTYKGTIAADKGQKLSLTFATAGDVTITGNIGGNAAATDTVSLLDASQSNKLTLTGDVYVNTLLASNITLNAGNYMFANTNAGKITLGDDATFKTGTDLGNVNFVLAAKTATFEDKVNLMGLTFDASGVNSGLVFSGKSIYNSTQGKDAFTTVSVSANAALTVDSEMNVNTFTLNGAGATLNLNSTLEVGAGGLIDATNPGALNLGNNSSVKGNIDFSARNSAINVDAGANATLDGAVKLGAGVVTLGGNGANLTITGATTDVTIETKGKNTDTLVLGADFDSKSIGTAANGLKSITLINDTKLDFTGESAYAQNFITSADGKGTIIWGVAGNEVTNVGSADKRFAHFELTDATTVAKNGSIYAETLALADQDLEVKSGASIIVTKSTTTTDGNGSVTFLGNGTFAGDFGAVAKNLAAFNIDGGKGTVVKGSGNVFATNIAQGINSTFVLTGDTVLKGASTLANNATVDVGTHSLTYTELAFNANITNNINITITDSDSGVVMINNITVDPTARVNMNVKDNRSIKEIINNSTVGVLGAKAASPGDAAAIVAMLEVDDIVTVSSNNRFVTYSPQLAIEHNPASPEFVADVQSTYSADFSKDMNRLGGAASTRDFASAIGKDPLAYAQLIDVFAPMTDDEYVDAVNRVSAAPSAISTVGMGVASAALAQSASRAAAVAAGDSDVKAGAWVEGFFGRGNQSARKTDAGFKSNTSGATVGVDAELNDNAVIGISATMARTNVKMKNYMDGDKTKVESYMLSVYGSLNFADNYVAEAAASFGNSKVKNTNKRIFAAGDVNAKSKFDGTSYGVKALVGYNYKVSDVTMLTPMVGLEYARFDAGNATETGAGVQNRKISTKQLDKMTGILGAKMNTNMELGDIDLTPEIHVFGGYDFKAVNPKSTVTLASNGAPIPVANAKAARTSVNVGMSLTAKYDMMEYGVGYDAKISDKYFGHQGSLKVRVNF